jgi:hypothetical protein
MFIKEIRNVILAFVFISIGGLLLHLRIHPLSKNIMNMIPMLSGICSVFVLPFMFNNRKMYIWAYMINLFSVVIGAIVMAAYSLTHPPEHITAITIILQTTLADILILIAKLPIAGSILQYWKSR